MVKNIQSPDLPASTALLLISCQKYIGVTVRTKHDHEERQIIFHLPYAHLSLDSSNAVSDTRAE